MEINDFIKSLAKGENAEAKDILDDVLGAKAFEAIQNKKIELAQSMFGGQPEMQEDDLTDEQEEIEDL